MDGGACDDGLCNGSRCCGHGRGRETMRGVVSAEMTAYDALGGHALLHPHVVRQ